MPRWRTGRVASTARGDGVAMAAIWRIPPETEHRNEMPSALWSTAPEPEGAACGDPANRTLGTCRDGVVDTFAAAGIPRRNSLIPTNAIRRGARRSAEELRLGRGSRSKRRFPPKAAVAGSLAPNRRTRPFSYIQARPPNGRCWHASGMTASERISVEADVALCDSCSGHRPSRSPAARSGGPGLPRVSASPAQ